MNLKQQRAIFSVVKYYGTAMAGGKPLRINSD